MPVWGECGLPDRQGRRHVVWKQSGDTICLSLSSRPERSAAHGATTHSSGVKVTHLADGTEVDLMGKLYKGGEFILFSLTMISLPSESLSTTGNRSIDANLWLQSTKGSHMFNCWCFLLPAGSALCCSLYNSFRPVAELHCPLLAREQSPRAGRDVKQVVVLNLT